MGWGFGFCFPLKQLEADIVNLCLCLLNSIHYSGIPDRVVRALAGNSPEQREIRLLLIAHLRLEPNSVLWTSAQAIPVEIGLLCPQGQIIAVERDEEVTNLIRRNCDRFEVKNVEVIEASAPV